MWICVPPDEVHNTNKSQPASMFCCIASYTEQKKVFYTEETISSYPYVDYTVCKYVYF